MKHALTLLITSLILIGCATIPEHAEKVRASDPTDTFTVSGDLNETLRCMRGSMAAFAVHPVSDGVVEITKIEPSLTITLVSSQPGGELLVVSRGPIGAIGGLMPNVVTEGLRRCAATP